MKKSNIAIAALAYAAGLLVALKFSKDGKEKNIWDLSADIKKIHANLWTEAEQKILSPANREKVAELKAKALAEISDFKKTAEKELKTLAKQSSLKKDEILVEAQKLYDRRSEIIAELMEQGEDIVESAKSEWEDVAKKFSKKISAVKKDLSKDLADAYKKLIKKIK
jgi:acyl-CoA reductase-like NAD-dependent aldehyde dehydrogenase